MREQCYTCNEQIYLEFAMECRLEPIDHMGNFKIGLRKGFIYINDLEPGER